MENFYCKFALTGNIRLALNRPFRSICLLCRGFRLGRRSCFYSASRKSGCYDFCSAFRLVSERMEREMSRLKEQKKRWQNENGKSSNCSVRPRIGGSRGLYGIGDAKGSLGNGTEGGAR